MSPVREGLAGCAIVVCLVGMLVGIVGWGACSTARNLDDYRDQKDASVKP